MVKFDGIEENHCNFIKFNIENFGHDLDTKIYTNCTKYFLHHEKISFVMKKIENTNFGLLTHG